jgi:hypothetical protein
VAVLVAERHEVGKFDHSLRHVAPFLSKPFSDALHAATLLLLEHRWAMPILLPRQTIPLYGSTANDEIGTGVTCVLQPLPPIVVRVLGHEQRAPAMLAYVVSEGRLFALNPSDWAMLLVGVALCGFVTLLF